MKRCVVAFCLAVFFLVPSVAFGAEEEVLSADYVKDLIKKESVTKIRYCFPKVGVSFYLPASWVVSDPEKAMSYFTMRISSPDDKIAFYCVEIPNDRRCVVKVLGSIGEFTSKVMPNAEFVEPQTVKFAGIEADKILSNGTIKGNPAFANLHEIKTDGKYILSIFAIGEYDSANTVNKDALKMFADTLAKLSPDKEPSPKDEKSHAPSGKFGTGKKNVDNSDFQ